METRAIRRLKNASMALVLGLLFGFAQSAQAQYTFRSIGAPTEAGFYTSVHGVNNAGVMVGNFVTYDWNVDGTYDDFSRGLMAIPAR